MRRFKHSRRCLDYRKCYYFLLILSTLSICLIIYYGIIDRNETNFMLLTFFNNNSNNNGSSNSQRSSSTNSARQQHLSNKHVVEVGSNKQLRDWHNYTNSLTSDLQRQQQQHTKQQQLQQYEQLQQHTISNFDKFVQMAITPTTNSTSEWKLIEKNEKSLQLTGFNLELSESLPLQRLIPDTRHEICKTKLYSAKLPSCSVIIIYHNEQPRVLYRSLFSLINRTPEELLQEIILVDDFSDARPEIDESVLKNFANIVQIIHLSQREGLIRARLRGAQKALGEVLVFLDAHIEVNENWLPPLLQPIGKNPKCCTTPIIDVIKYDTLEYQGSMPSRGGFNWQFNYVQLPLLKEEVLSNPEPHINPVMNGGLFAIKRDYFWQLGGYDEGLEIWGAEQFELSFKIWMCGGELLEVPCSRVGHLYRAPEFQVKYSVRKDDFISKNYKRVAEVWMDEYKEYLYEHVPKLTQIPAGDLSKQKQLRSQLKCKSFKWFLHTIAFDLLKTYPPIKPPDFAKGAIQSLALPKLCLDLSFTKSRQQLKDVLKLCSPDLKYPYAGQRFHLSFRHDLRHQEECLEVQTWSSHASLWLWPCHNLGGNQFWYYDQNSQMLIQGKTDFLKRCLELDKNSLKLFVNYCDFAKLEQKWQFGFVNQTAMEHFFEGL